MGQFQKLKMALIYPPDNHTTDSKSIFFIGSFSKSCTINGQKIKANDSGNFCFIANLELGENCFKINLDDEFFTRTISTKAAPQLNPVAYAYAYEAFTDDNSSSKNILRSIIIKTNSISFPFNSKPDYDLSLIANSQLNIIFQNTDLDCDWVHIIDQQNIRFEGSISKNLNFFFNKPVQNYRHSFDGKYLNIDFDFLTLEHPIICLDPGHGGNNLGTTSLKGFTEKDANLKQALSLKSCLEKLGHKVILTRETDKEISLKERVEFGQKHQAKIFLSLHHNALPDGRNPTQERGISAHYFCEHSKELAKKLLISLTDQYPSAGLFRQNLFVLRENTTIFSVLLELGFMIHPDESELIIKDEFIKDVSEKLALTLDQFINPKSVIMAG